MIVISAMLFSVLILQIFEKTLCQNILNHFFLIKELRGCYGTGAVQSNGQDGHFHPPVVQGSPDI